MSQFAVLLLMQLLAFWPVWPWYVTRMLDGSDEPLGFLALGTVLALCWLQPPQPSSPDQPRLLLWPLLSTLGYVLGYAYLPPLLRAALAMLALGCTLSRYWCGRAYHVGLGGLLLLALPLVASLQFYVGYPLRLVTAALTALLLRLSGFAVYQEGPGLHWGGLTVGVDAPCSGIYMCWTGVYLALTLACVYRLSTWQTWHALAVALVVLVLGNTLRTAALFYPEAGIVVLPPWVHDGVGVVTFLAIALVLGSAIRHHVGALVGRHACGALVTEHGTWESRAGGQSTARTQSEHERKAHNQAWRGSDHRDPRTRERNHPDGAWATHLTRGDGARRVRFDG